LIIHWLYKYIYWPIKKWWIGCIHYNMLNVFIKSFWFSNKIPYKSLISVVKCCIFWVSFISATYNYISVFKDWVIMLKIFFYAFICYFALIYLLIKFLTTHLETMIEEYCQYKIIDIVIINYRSIQLWLVNINQKFNACL